MDDEEKKQVTAQIKLRLYTLEKMLDIISQQFGLEQGKNCGQLKYLKQMGLVMPPFLKE